MSEDPEDLLRYHLHAALVRSERERWHAEYVHASATTSEAREFCPREEALLHELGADRAKTRSIHAASAYSYELGHVYQDLVTRLLGRRVWGDWLCSCGHREECVRRPLRCVVCGADAWRYLEVRGLAPESGLGGALDLLVALPARQLLTLVEVKSIKQEDFRTLRMPLAEHRKRVCLYLRTVAESPLSRLVDASEGRLLYCCKGGWGARDESVRSWRIVGDATWSPFREFAVPRDDACCEVAWRKGIAVERYRRGDGMPQGICAQQFCARAKACAVNAACFSGDYPATQRAAGWLSGS